MTYTLPRHLDGATPSSLVHNTAAAEVDALAWSITVRRNRRWVQVEGGGTSGPAANVDYVIPWETVSGGSNRGNWSPGLAPAVTITQSGTYLMLLQVRFPYPYSGDVTGRRWARIMLNGTSPVSDTIGVNAEADWSYPNTGMTVQALSVRPLQAGDTLWCGFRGSLNLQATTGGALSDALLVDRGGTYFTVVRIGPGAGALTSDLSVGGSGGVPRLESGSLPPAEPLNFFAQAIDNLGVCARPRRTTDFTVPFGVGLVKIIEWQQDGIDTRGDMWDPAEPTKTTIRVSGTYFFELRVRWSVAGSYQAGGHSARLYMNTTAEAGLLVEIIKPPPTAWEGSLCLARAVLRCSVGDVIYAGAQSGDGTSTVAANFFGGCYLFAARVGRSGDGGSVIEGQSYDTGPVPEEARTLRDGPMGGVIRDEGIVA